MNLKSELQVIYYLILAEMLRRLQTRIQNCKTTRLYDKIRYGDYDYSAKYDQLEHYCHCTHNRQKENLKAWHGAMLTTIDDQQGTAYTLQILRKIERHKVYRGILMTFCSDDPKH